MSNYLVVNLGLKSIRIIVIDESGQQIYSNSRPVYSRLKDDRVEQNAVEWNNHLEQLMSELRENTSLAETIKYITSTTSSSCIYGVNSMFEPVTRVMMVSDKRAKDEVSVITNLASFTSSAKKNGFKCSTSSTVPKILWYKNNRPSVYAQVHKWIGASEFIHYFFTKCYVSDPLNAGKAFHDGSEYDRGILSDLGLSSEVLPEVVSIGTDFEIGSDVCKSYGLDAKCRFVITTYDAICAVVGSYDGSNKTACDVSGTVTSVRVLTDQKIGTNPESVILSQELGIENKRLIGASNNMGGGIIEWCKQAFYDESDRNVYYSMENNAHDSSVGAKGIIFLPYLLGERAPFRAVNAKASFFGISRYTKKEDFTRAVLESTAYVTCDLLGLSLEAGLEVDTISVSGGLARFDLVNQIKADVTNRCVKVLENFESTSVGAYILMALAIGKYKSLAEASEQAVRVRKVIHPSEKNHLVYREFYELFKELNLTLLKSYDKHKSILEKIDSHTLETLRNL